MNLWQGSVAWDNWNNGIVPDQFMDTSHSCFEETEKRFPLRASYVLPRDVTLLCSSPERHCYSLLFCWLDKAISSPPLPWLYWPIFLLSLSWSMPPFLYDVPMSWWHSLWLWICKQKIPPEHFTTVKTSLKLCILNEVLDTCLETIILIWFRVDLV
jgi:hypothetical protein